MRQFRFHDAAGDDYIPHLPFDFNHGHDTPPDQCSIRPPEGPDGFLIASDCRTTKKSGHFLTGSGALFKDCFAVHWTRYQSVIMNIYHSGLLKFEIANPFRRKNEPIISQNHLNLHKIPIEYFFHPSYKSSSYFRKEVITGEATCFFQ
jgi:hypothetical protein